MDSVPGDIEVRLFPGPLARRAGHGPAGAGAVICFEGVVRGIEDARPILGLEYEGYEPMTTRELSRLADETSRRYELLAIRVEHSIGRVPPGEVSFRLEIASRHRGPALRAMDEFINRLKLEIPLWKVPIWADAVGAGATEGGG